MVWCFENKKTSPFNFLPQVNISPKIKLQLSDKKILFLAIKFDCSCGTAGCGIKQNAAPFARLTSICCVACCFMLNKR